MGVPTRAKLVTIVAHSLVAPPLVFRALCLCWPVQLSGGALIASVVTASFEATGSIEAFPSLLLLPTGLPSIALIAAVAVVLGAQNLGPYKTSRVARIAHKNRAGQSISACKDDISMVPRSVVPLSLSVER